MCANPPRVWVGQPPEGLEGFELARTPDDVKDAAVIVLDPAPAPRHAQALVAKWTVPVVVCFQGPPDPVAARAWHEAGAWCISRQGLTAPEVARLIERIAQHHSPGLTECVRHVFGLEPRLSFSFRTLEDAERVASVLALALPFPERRLAGIVELLLNAIEHGNLGLQSDEKHRLLMSGQWRAELDRRLTTAPWCERKVTVALVADAAGWELSIEDMGDGFTPGATAIPEGALHGRGLALARAAFDSLTWEGRGNRVVAKVAR